MSPRPRTVKALAVSTLVHAALFGALLFAVRPLPSPRPLAIRLLSLPAQALASLREGALEAPGEDTRPGPHLPPRVARRPKAVEALPSPSASEVVAPAPLLRPEVASGGGSAEGPVSEAVGQESPRAGGGPGGEAAPAGAAFGIRLSELHRRLAEAAARCYPSAARRLRLVGEVPLHFCLDAAGVARGLSLEGSTGSAVLDRSALECVVPGAQPLSGFEGCFLVPVRFGG